MVKPVVLVCDIVGFVASHTAERRFAAVPVSVAADGDIFRASLEVDSSVAFCLVGITSSLSVEEVDVVQPDVGVACVERDTVVHAEHDGEVAHLQTFTVAHKNAESADGGILADTLDGDGH